MLFIELTDGGTVKYCCLEAVDEGKEEKVLLFVGAELDDEDASEEMEET